MLITSNAQSQVKDSEDKIHLSSSQKLIKLHELYLKTKTDEIRSLVFKQDETKPKNSQTFKVMGLLKNT